MKLIERLEELWNSVLKREDIEKKSAISRVVTDLIEEDDDSMVYHEDIYILLKAMIYAAKADGKIDESEQRTIMEFMGEMSKIEQLFVEQEMQRESNFESFVNEVPENMRKQVYYMSLFAIDLDVESERKYLERLADALGLEKYEISAIHDSLEVGAVA